MPMVMRAGLLARDRRKLARRIDLHIGVDHQNRGIDRGHADGGKILQRIVRQVAAERGIDGDRADGREEQRVAVGIGFRDIFRRYRAVGARLVSRCDGTSPSVRCIAVGDRRR